MVLEMLEQSFSDAQQLLAMLILLFGIVINVEPELPSLVRQKISKLIQRAMRDQTLRGRHPGLLIVTVHLSSL